MKEICKSGRQLSLFLCSNSHVFDSYGSENILLVIYFEVFLGETANEKSNLVKTGTIKPRCSCFENA
jgi:hypothetical protein